MKASTNPSKKRQGEKGFVALITATLISFIVLVSTISLAQQSIRGRFSLLNREFKEKSYAVARGCLTLAEIALYHNPLFVVTDKKIISNLQECTLTVRTDTSLPHQSEIVVWSTFHESTTRIRALFDTTTHTYISVEEISHQ